MKPWTKKETNKYTSHDIQNECLQVLALQILCKVSLKIPNSACVSIMADESTAWHCKQGTVHNQQQVGRWRTFKITKTSLASIRWKVLMQTVWSSPSSMLFSGCDSSCLHVVASATYDGASNMSDNRNDVATQISTEEKHEIYVHRCWWTIKQSKLCLETALEVTKLICQVSPKRNAAFDWIKSELTEKDTRICIHTFCRTSSVVLVN